MRTQTRGSRNGKGPNAPIIDPGSGQLARNLLWRNKKPGRADNRARKRPVSIRPHQIRSRSFIMAYGSGVVVLQRDPTTRFRLNKKCEETFAIMGLRAFPSQGDQNGHDNHPRSNQSRSSTEESSGEPDR